MFWFDLFKASVMLLIIIDPFLSLSIFINITRNMSDKERNKGALTAVWVAGILLITFLFCGLTLLDALSISINAFRIAGGIILLILGVTQVLGIEYKKGTNATMGVVIIGTPMLSGPAALLTIISLTDQYGILIPLIASVIVLIISWAVLRFSSFIIKIVGDRFLEIFSRILGLLLAGIGIEFIIKGVMGVIISGI
ncbi:MAG: MarC family protein [Candidatus Woesearchaeota archaeon]